MSNKTSKHFTLVDVRDIVKEEYGPELYAALEAALAVIGSLSVKERTNPLALIFEGASGLGKSTVINMCQPTLLETRDRLYRLDTFTPKAFVTHSASTARDKLAEIDLLPKLKDKVLLTKELAPLFRGSDNDLRGNFAMLTAVLDGKGHVSASGVHGTRGYEGKYVFNWLGGTTPIPPRTDEIMGQMGNRLLRYEIAGIDLSEEELLAFASSAGDASTEEVCREGVNDFLLGYFKQHPLNSVDSKLLTIEEPVPLGIVRLAKLTAQGRVEITRSNVSWDQELQLLAGAPEGPHRLINAFKLLGCGAALIHGRMAVTPTDLKLIRHVAFSSIPEHRRYVLFQVVAQGGRLNSEQAARALKVSRPTARAWMRELAATGIVKWKESNGNSPEAVVLGKEWHWLVPGGPSRDVRDEESEAEERDTSPKPVAQVLHPLAPSTPQNNGTGQTTGTGLPESDSGACVSVA